MGIDFLFILKALIIAIVEGLTEFVPVSSTGHMILVGDLIHFNTQSGGFPEMYEVVIQLGAILAVVVLYWRKISSSVVEFLSYIFSFIGLKTSGDKRKYEKRLAESETGFRFGINVIIGTIPAAIEIKEYLFSTKTVAIGFIVGGILLIVIENNFRKRAKRSKIVKDIDKMTYGQSLLVGCFQCLSLWPGMSRSASTIMGGWISGLSTTVATEFTFFLAIPAMVGASGLDLFKFDYSQMNATNWISLILGFIVAFIVSLVVIDKFINYLKKKPMRVFAIYRVFAGIVLAILIFTKVIS